MSPSNRIIIFGSQMKLLYGPSNRVIIFGSQMELLYESLK
jgi:hypothetical protein